MTERRSSAPLEHSRPFVLAASSHTRAPLERRGSTLAMALLLVSTAALLSVLALQRGLDSWRSQAGSTSQKLAFYMAEAGLAEARDDLVHGGSGNVGARETPAVFGSGAFWVETVTDEYNVSFITSTGLYDGAAFRLSQAIQRPPLPLAEYGFYGQYGVELGEDSVVKPLDPDTDEEAASEAEGGLVEGVGGVVEDVVGEVVDGEVVGGVVGGLVQPILGGGKTLGLGGKGTNNKAPLIALRIAPPPSEDPPMLVGSDAGVVLGKGATVLGAIAPGPDHTIELALGTSVTGSVLPEENHRELPAIAMPIEELEQNLTCLPALPGMLASGVHAYSTITVGPLAQLEIVGPASVLVSTLRVAAGGSIVANTTDGAVHIYVDEALTVSAGATVTSSSGDPSKFVLLIGGRGAVDTDGDGIGEAPVTWQSSQPVSAALYAPGSTIELPDNIHWRGSIVSQRLRVGSGAVLELDARLLDVEVAARDHRLLSWRTLDIPADERQLLRQDPVAKAKRLGIELPSPAAARVPATNEYHFTTPEGDTLTYHGTSLLDLTLKIVDAVVPVVAEVGDVPAFPKYSDDKEDEAEDAADIDFQNAWDYATGFLPAPERGYFETGEFPPGLWNAVVVVGTSVEPYASIFNDPSILDVLTDQISTSYLPDTSKVFVKAVIVNGP